MFLSDVALPNSYICFYVTNRINLISENTENIFIVCSIKVQVNEQFTDFSFYFIHFLAFLNCPNFVFYFLGCCIL